MFAKFIIVLFSLLILPASAVAQSANIGAYANIINLEGQTIGSATFSAGPQGVLIEINVTGLTPGSHGLHLHSAGLCEPDQGFKTASGHVGKTEGGHGMMNPHGPEAGDLPNLIVGEDGSAI
jgi:Cu-Zn family superoxide dismutase